MLALLAPSCAVDPKTGAQSFAGVTISDDPCAPTATVVGAFLGAVAGGVIANQVNHRKDTKVIGVAAGALVGGMIGRDIDRRRCEIFRISKKYNMEIAVVPVEVPRGQVPPPGAPQTSANAATAQPGGQAQQAAKSDGAVIGLSVVVRDSGQQFASGSDELTPQARGYFREIGDQYSYARQAPKLGAQSPKADRDAVESLRTKRILLIGHTDDTGSSRDNANLSERRAMTVAKVFRDQGIPDSQIFYQGAGETLPMADNRTDEGRATNRRVEIIDVTDDASFQKYLSTRTQQVEYYRPAPSHAVAAPTRQTVPPGSAQAKIPTDTKKPAGSTQTAAQAKPPAATPTQASVIAPTTAAASATALFDFGGVPASMVTAVADFGTEIPSKSGFTLISPSYASGEPVVASCSSDRPRVANGVKSLRNQKEISITEYMPGLYGSSWMDTVNGNLVGLSHVAVYRDGGSPAARPNLFIYKDYKPGSGAKPDFSAQPDVNVYRGDKAILYRVFVDGPVKCMDVLFPYDNSGAARNSNLFYDRQSEAYVASFKPRLAR